MAPEWCSSWGLASLTTGCITKQNVNLISIIKVLNKLLKEITKSTRLLKRPSFDTYLNRLISINSSIVWKYYKVSYNIFHFYLVWNNLNEHIWNVNSGVAKGTWGHRTVGLLFKKGWEPLHCPITLGNKTKLSGLCSISHVTLRSSLQRDETTNKQK